MTELLLGFLATVLLTTLLPGLAIRAIVLAYPRSDPRRRELINERYVIPRRERPFWIFEQLETAICEALPARVQVARKRRAGEDGLRMLQRGRDALSEQLAGANKLLCGAPIHGDLTPAIQHLSELLAHEDGADKPAVRHVDLATEACKRLDEMRATVVSAIWHMNSADQAIREEMP